MGIAKAKYPSLFGLLAVLMLVTMLAVPAHLASPAPVEADPDILRWSILDTPNSIPEQTDSILSPSEIDKLVVGSDGATFLAVVTQTALAPPMKLYATGVAGRVWWDGTPAAVNVWDVAMAPDDANLWAAVTSDATNTFPQQVWVTQDGGTTWVSTFLENFIGAGAYISCIDISPDYGGRRDIAVGTRDGTGLGTAKVWTLPVPGFGNWLDQSSAAAGQGNPTADWTNGDVFDIKFSPTYAGDATLVIAASDNGSGTQSGCFINTAVRDLAQNASVWGPPVWVRNPSTITIVSATANLAVDMDLELPSDFSGQAASLRRFYVSIDDGGRAATESGIYRIDDTTVYQLMDTTASTATGRRISTIAYYGTYASGKLLAGEVRGDPCSATVPTWFTDSPTTCPIPCWYPAKKPTTGAAAMLNCSDNVGWGNAQVAWAPDGATACGDYSFQEAS